MVGDPSFFTDCAGARHGDTCMAKCNPGYSGTLGLHKKGYET